MNSPFNTHGSGAASQRPSHMMNPREMNNPIPQPFTFATPPSDDKPIAPELVTVPKRTVDELKELLSNISTTFQEHGMFELAAKAESIAQML